MPAPAFLLFKPILHVLAPGQQGVDIFRALVNIPLGQLLHQNLQVILDRGVIGLGCFHNAVDNCAGLGPSMLSLNNQFFRPTVKDRIAFSARLLEI